MLPAEYGSIDPAVFVTDEHLRYPSPGGQVPAILLKPASVAPGERLPAVIEVHGGPTAQHWRTFAPLAQRLVDQGYVVLRPNPRGSTGYGVAWRDGSAIHFVENLRAKLLILHGLNDPRCPISQARTFRDRMVALGKREGTGPDDDFEYHEFDDEGHGFGGARDQQLRSYQLILYFLGRRL